MRVVSRHVDLIGTLDEQGRIVARLIPRRSEGGRFVKVYVVHKRALMQRAHLSGKGYQVLAHLELEAKRDNELPTPTELSVKLSLHRSVVSRAYSELVKAEFIFKHGPRYYLSPLVGWHGSDRELDIFYQEIFTELQAVQLPQLPVRTGQRQAYR